MPAPSKSLEIRASGLVKVFTNERYFFCSLFRASGLESVLRKCVGLFMGDRKLDLFSYFTDLF